MSKINRRDVLKNVAALGSLVLPVSAFAFAPARVTVEGTSSPQGMPAAVDKQQLELRKKLRFRTRRIIMNNDGNDINFPVDKPVTPELFLNKRTSPLIGTHVDSFFYCDGVNNCYSHTSELTDYPVNNERAMYTINEFKRIGLDPLGIYVNFCRQHNKEVFWSMRMNDTHDSSIKDIEHLTKWKRDHTDYLMGKPGVKSLFSNRWSSMDYGKAEVRERVLLTFKDVASRYDVDGIELDFFRHPIFFKAQYDGGSASQGDCDKMSQLIRDMRSVCDSVGKKRGRPVLISIRIPDSLPLSKAMGLDVETWLKEDLIDLMAGADYFKMEPWGNWAKIGREYGVPVYAVLVERRITDTLKAEGELEVERWRGEALIAWNSGVNGIYTFNRFKPSETIFRELGDPSLLHTLTRVNEQSYVNPAARSVVNPDYWLKGASKYLKKA